MRQTKIVVTRWSNKLHIVGWRSWCERSRLICELPVSGRLESI